MSRSVQEQLDRLMRAATRRQEALPRRCASVRNVHSLLRTPQGQAAGQIMLLALWPAALQLLQDNQVEMRQTVAPVVGFLGALAARPGRPAGVSPNLLFEWAMPILSGQGIAGWKHLDVGIQCWVLVALKEGLAAADVHVLHHHALSVLALCHNLLKSEATSVHLIAPVLGLVSEASRHQPSLRATFSGLVDLLVAWWLEPKLDDIVRPLLARTLESLQPGWQHDPSLGKLLLTRLLQDLQSTVAESVAISTERHKRFLRLCNCIEAIFTGCRQKTGMHLSGLLAEWVKGMTQGLKKSQGLFTPASSQTASLIEQLCAHSQHAITTALVSSSQKPTDAVQHRKLHTSSQTTTAVPALQEQQQQHKGGQPVLAPVQALVTPIMELVVTLAAVSKEGVAVPVLLRPIKLARSVLDAVQQQGGEVAAEHVDAMVGKSSVIGKLRTHCNPQIAEEVMRLHAFLLLCPATRSVATQRTVQQMLHTVRHLLLEVSMTSEAADTVGTAALGTVTSTDDKDQKSCSGGDTGLHEQLSSISMCISAVDEAVSVHHDAAVCLAIWRQVVHLAPPTGPLEIDPDTWLALLSLLRNCWQNMQSISTTELAALLSKLTRGTAHSAIHSLVIAWASGAATQFLHFPTDSNAPLTAPAAPAPTLHSSTPLSVPRQSGIPKLSCPDALLDVMLRLCRGREPSTRHVTLQALNRLTHSASSLEPHQLAAIIAVACYSLTDPAELVSQAASQLLVALCAPTFHSIMSSAVQASQQELPWRRLYALQPQQIAFQPEQLAKVLDWLEQGNPLVVSQPSKVGGPSAASDEWLWRLLQTCQPVSGTVNLPLASGAAAWYAVQEAAKHCTGVRMRTHLGNPTQTFAALERMLQDMLSKLTSAASEPPSLASDTAASAPQLYSVPAARSTNEAPLLEPTWMLLEMMQAVEKNMYSAYAGCCLRSAGYASTAISFYRSNRKVCEDWFTRMRLLLLRTSAASNAPPLTLHHAYARLIDLKSQLRHLQAAAAAEAAQQLQEQLQAQRQQVQLEEAQAAEQQAEPQDSSQSARQNLLSTGAEKLLANDSPVAEEVQPHDDQPQPLSSLQPRPHDSHTKQPTGQSSNHLAANPVVIGSPVSHPPQQPPAASPSTSKPAAAPVSLLTGKVTQPSKQAPMGLLEIQAEQEAEAARRAEAARTVQPVRHGKGKPRSDGSQSSKTAAASSQPGQPRVLQVKRQKPGQAAAAVLPLPKVVPLTKTTSGKMAVPATAPTPAKIKLMSRPQTSLDASLPTDPQPTLRQNSDSIPGAKQSSNQARLARAQAAARLASELQEVLRHASLAMLHLADADAISGLQHYCLHTFGRLHQLTDGGSGRKEGSKSSSSLLQPTHGAGEGKVGKEDAITARLQHPTSLVEGSVEQSQFDWLEGVALQAAAKHEEAAGAYSRSLQQQSSQGGSLGTDGKAFLVDRCCEAYSAVADWQGLQQWLQDMKAVEQTGDRQAAWPLSPAQEHKYDALAALDAGHLQEAQHAFDLSVWSDLKNDKGGVHAVQAAEATTLKALMQLHAPSPVKQRAGRDKRAIRTMLQNSRETLLQSIAVSAQTGLQSITGHLTALHSVVSVQESVPAPAPVLSAADAPPGFAPKTSTEPSTPSPFALKLWPFGDAQQHPQPRQWPAQDVAPLLQLLRVYKVLASKSKQQVPQQLLGNILLSASAAATHSPSQSQRLVQEVKSVNPDQASPTLSAQLHLLELQQLHNKGGSCCSSAVDQLSNHIEATLPEALIADSSDGPQRGLAQSVVQAVLQLAEWGQTCNGTVTYSRQAQMLGKLREVALGSSEASQPYLPLDPSPPALCLAAAVKLAPASATAWLAYADYLHSLCSLHPSSTHLQSSTSASSQGSAETTHKSQPGSDESDTLDSSHWQMLTQMVKAYCTHLKLAAQSLGLAGLPEDHMPVLLKLLQLLNMEELAPECLNAIRAGVMSIPVLTWRCVVPQLFALLAHRNARVWQLAQQLLQALELLDPAAVLYPALVESRRSNSGHSSTMPGLQALVQGCHARQPQLVQQVESMMTELEHMSVLWAELWHVALLELQAEVARRVPSLQEEVKRISSRQDLDLSQRLHAIRDRYTTILAPAAHMLQQRLSLHTTQSPETPQQEEFASRHLPLLKQAAAALSSPSDEVLMHPEQIWNAFKPVTKAIAQQLSAREVQLSSLSPVLSQMAATAIPIPGLIPCNPLPPSHPQYASAGTFSASAFEAAPQAESAGTSHPPPYQISSAEMVTVSSFKPPVHVMSTKTRPKRIGIVGSDGKTYTFLLKGWEDLRLDERLMQLIKTFAVTLSSDADTARRQLLPCPLNVTPLAPRMGLIQWVDHTMPLYGVYKAWQHRQLAEAAESQKAQEGQSGQQPTGKGIAAHPPRATDAFYAKLMPALEAAGLPRNSPRRDWPLPVLKQVLTDSIQETPRQLLARELWCGSGSASEWWSFQAGYTSSTAAMSMVGYLLGLGDRHLDNILLDKHTGRVVHIDYNIVFEMGQQLRVPEIVPFRLTHTLQAALGVTGLEGGFRQGCQHILRVSRQHSSTLSGLLQAILTDPLVAWAPDKQQAGSKKDADAAVALNLFSSRVTEHKQPCDVMIMALAAALPEALAALQAYEAVHSVADKAATAARAAHQQVLQAQASQASAASSIQAFTLRLQQAQASIAQLGAELHSNQRLLQTHLRECQGWASRHQHTVKALRDQLPQELMLPNNHWMFAQAPVLLGLVSRLGGSGMPSLTEAALQTLSHRPQLPQALLQQAYAVDQQAVKLLTQRQQGILAGFAGLQAYSAALRLVLPDGYADTTHHGRWAQAIDLAVDATNSQSMHESMCLTPHTSDAQDVLATWHALKAVPSQVHAVSQCLQQQLSHLQTDRQQGMLSSADAKADLMGCLEAVTGNEQGSRAMECAVRHSMLAAVDRLQASTDASATLPATFYIHGFAEVLHLVSDSLQLQSSLQWAVAYQVCLQLQGRALQCLAAEVLPVLLTHHAVGLGPSTEQYAARLAALSSETDETVAAMDQLDADSLQHAEFLATYHDQVAELSAPSLTDLESENNMLQSTNAAQLAKLTSAWDNREQTASQLRDRAEALRTHQQSLTAQTNELLSPDASLSDAPHHLVEPVALVQPAVAKFFAALQQVASASQQLLTDSGDAPSPTTATWKTSLFVVKTVQAVLSSCFNASSNPAGDLHASESSWQASIARHAIQALQTSFGNWNQTTLVPSLILQLRRSGSSLASTQQVQQAEDPNGILPSVLHDLSALELEVSGSSGTGQTGIGMKGEPSLSAAGLVPFSDFDTALAGADQTLEFAQEELSQQQAEGTSLELEAHEVSVSPAQATQAGMADFSLVPFNDFDEALGGADETLEAADADNALKAEITSNSLSSQDSGSTAAVATVSEQVQRLSEAMTRYVLSVGAVTAAEQQAAAVATARAEAESSLESGKSERQLAALEWEHEEVLSAALQLLGGLGQPVVILPKDPAAQPNWSLSIRRSQVIHALETELGILAGLEDAWLAWRQASAQTEARLKHVLASSRPNCGLHNQLFDTRQQWLSGCDEVAGWLERTAQNVLQLEHSRQGVVWSQSAGADDKPFAECSALLQQRQYMVSALDAAQEEVVTAQQALPQLQQQASDAAAQLQPSQAQERQQGQCFAQQAPKLLQVAAALLQPVQECQVAAQEAVPGVEAMLAALKDVLGPLEGSHAAKEIREGMSFVQQQLSALQQHGTALQHSLAAVADAADQDGHISKALPLGHLPQSKPAKGISRSKRAALVLDAMKPILATALEQVQLPEMDGQALSELARSVQGLPQHAKVVAGNIHKAYQGSSAQTANSLILASDVADAQPASSDPMTVMTSVASSRHAASSRSNNSQSDPAALAGSAGDDLEQDSKAVLKAGGQDATLTVCVQDGSRQKHYEQAKKAQQKAFAAATLETFESKLYGRDGTKHSAMDVEKLVDQVLQQATCQDNLCQMYEGWTAWI